MLILQPEFLWTGSQFARDLAVYIDDGKIARIAKPQAADSSTVKLSRRAIIPGFVNAHSHAFQRALRREAQRFDTGAGNFWSWRETMYRLAQSLDVNSFHQASKECFEEMLDAGMTSVGEFHYLHHANAACDDFAFDDAVISAAKGAGIRLRLIQTYYATGNVNQPLAGFAQQRFCPVSRERFVAQLEKLGAAIACHSIRAVSLDDLKYFRDYAHANHLPFHIHVEEVQKEIDDCIAAYGKTPMRAILDHLRIDANVTAIHCTHTKSEDLVEYAQRGGRVCLCPLTEGNLSDGFPDLPAMRKHGAKICIGGDSNIRISMNEELRLLEFGQRARRMQRGIVVDQTGRNAPALLELATKNGADSLSLNCGEISAGKFADLLAIDLDHPSMRGCADDAILDSLIFGSGNGPIRDVWVNGKRVRGK